MKKLIILILSLVMLISFAACSTTDQNINDRKLIVAVGIVPEATFVEKIAGDLVEIVTLIPPGNSPANYQPTAVQMQSFSEASIYFAMQTPTEVANILPKVEDFNENMNVILLRDVVSETYPVRMMSSHSHGDEDEDHDDHDEDHDGHDEDHDDEDHDESEETPDPHIWLSPKRVMIIVQTIADELSELDSENADTYQQNAADYIKELEDLDTDIKNTVNEIDNKAFLIYHGSYGYFADDYGLTMISLESEGKQVTASTMQEVIDFALEEGITTVFYQAEFDDNQAKTVAEEIGGNVLQAAPLSPNYTEALKEFAQALSSQGD